MVTDWVVLTRSLAFPSKLPSSNAFAGSQHEHAKLFLARSTLFVQHNFTLQLPFFLYYELLEASGIIFSIWVTGHGI